jgi:hypothetical protein
VIIQPGIHSRGRFGRGTVVHGFEEVEEGGHNKLQSLNREARKDREDSCIKPFITSIQRVFHNKANIYHRLGNVPEI